MSNITPIVSYHHQQLTIGGCTLSAIADEFGTPCYIYDKNTIAQRYLALKNALNDQNHNICFAVKSNSNLSILRTLAQLGAGFDVVSKGEIYRAIKAGADPSKMVFSGVGKTTCDIEYAIEHNLACINVESWAEMERISHIATAHQKIVQVGFRVNPNIDAKTHPYISTGLKKSKFGVPIDVAVDYFEKAAKLPGICIQTISCHIGSQITTLEPFHAAITTIIALYHQLQKKGIHIACIDIGGGIGVCYENETLFDINHYGTMVQQQFAGLPVQVVIEPGRYICANSGVLLTKIEYIKQDDPHLNPFIIVDAGMNDLLRPMLYDAKHHILPLQQKASTHQYNIVGPVCESTDIFATDLFLPKMKQGDILAICDAGAYGFSMSSNYNSRPKPCEIMVEKGKAVCIRKRESLEDLIKHETTPLAS